jgi:DNA-binding NtrC family response regulator
MPDSPQKDKKQKAIDRIVGESAVILEIKEKALRLAGFDTPVIIWGPSGVGKELIAQVIYEASARNSKPFIACDCGALQDSLEQSELFGHSKGAFTGALYEKIGFIESAHKGILFLDEFQNLSIQGQKKLLRVLQEKKVTKVGSTIEKSVDFRLIVATNKDLYGMVENNEFREDLFYRIYVNPIEIPSLNDWDDDVVIIAKHLIKFYCNKFGVPLCNLSKGSERVLKDYHWPGNVRELQNVCQRLVVNHNPENKGIKKAFVKSQIIGELSRVVDERSPEVDERSQVVDKLLSVVDKLLRDKLNDNTIISNLWRHIDEHEKIKIEDKNHNDESKKERLYTLKDVEKQIIKYGLNVLNQSPKKIAGILGVDTSTITRKIEKHSLR